MVVMPSLSQGSPSSFAPEVGWGSTKTFSLYDLSFSFWWISHLRLVGAPNWMRVTRAASRLPRVAWWTAESPSWVGANVPRANELPAESPSSSWTALSAPAAASRRIAEEWPRLLAQCRGVRPLGVNHLLSIKAHKHLWSVILVGGGRYIGSCLDQGLHNVWMAIQGSPMNSCVSTIPASWAHLWPTLT